MKSKTGRSTSLTASRLVVKSVVVCAVQGLCAQLSHADLLGPRILICSQGPFWWGVVGCVIALAELPVVMPRRAWSLLEDDVCVVTVTLHLTQRGLVLCPRVIALKQTNVFR